MSSDQVAASSDDPQTDPSGSPAVDFNPPTDIPLPAIPIADVQSYPGPSVGSLLVVHFIFLATSLLVVVAAMTMSVPGEERVYLPFFKQPVPGLCSSRELFNIECPGCGLTRSFISMADGRIARAWHFNPAGIAFFLFVVVQIPYRIVQLWFIQQHQRELWPGKFNWLLWAVMGSVFLQWFVRVLPGLLGW